MMLFEWPIMCAVVLCTLLVVPTHSISDLFLLNLHASPVIHTNSRQQERVYQRVYYGPFSDGVAHIRLFSSFAVYTLKI
jgi:hypothetical protein